MIHQSALIDFTKKKCEIVNTTTLLTIDAPNERNVHDLRVNLRRFMSTIQFLKYSYEGNNKDFKGLNKQKKKLKHMFIQLNDLRDTQALIVYLNLTLQTSTDFTSFISTLKKRELEILIEMPNKMAQWELINIENNLLKVINKQIFSPNELELKIHLYLRILTENLHTRIDALSYGPEAFHKVRISLKKLRYFLELLEDGFQIKQPTLSLLKSWQDRLGHLQDLEVLLSILEDDHFNQSKDSIILKTNIHNQISDLRNSLQTDIYDLKSTTQKLLIKS